MSKKVKFYDTWKKVEVMKSEKQFEAAEKWYKGRFTKSVPKTEPLPKVEKKETKKD